MTMFGPRKNDRRELFKKAMLMRGKKTPPRRNPVEREKKMLPWTAFFLWLAFGIVSGYMLFFSPGLSVTTVEVTGESILPLTEYEDFVDRMITGRYFGFVPKNNFFLIPVQGIESGLYAQYPKIAHVSLERKFPSKIQIGIEEAPLLFRWCSGGPCYGLREGRLVSLPATEDPRYDTARLSVIDQSARLIHAGEKLEIMPYFEAFDFFYQKFSQVVPTALTRMAYTPSRYSNELMLTTDEGWVIQLSVARSPESSLRALQVFLDDYAKSHSDRKNLARIDLRVDGKIFFSDRLSEERVSESKSEKK